MTIFALLPTLLVALLKYQLVRSYSSTARFFSDTHTPDDLGKPTPRFEHDVLRPDWLPRWNWNTNDLDALRQMAEEHPGLRDVIPQLKAETKEKETKRKRGFLRKQRNRNR
jgi:hypothetical protein